jgi:SOS-response transcriptional repressor LexA
VTALRDPILGERARRALLVDAGGRKRRKLLVLLAAYADAGVEDPPLQALMGRAGIRSSRQADALLRALEEQGLIRVDWARGRPRRNHYELLITHEEAPPR